jgi:hypothetical protein
VFRKYLQPIVKILQLIIAQSTERKAIKKGVFCD